MLAAQQNVKFINATTRVKKILHKYSWRLKFHAFIRSTSSDNIVLSKSNRSWAHVQFALVPEKWSERSLAVKRKQNKNNFSVL